MKNKELREGSQPHHGLGERIVKRRKARGWTQGELARLAGLRSDRLSRLERESHQPNVRELASLAEALGTSIDDLVFDSPGSRGPVLELERTTTSEERALIQRLWTALVLGLTVLQRVEADREDPQ